MFAHRLMLVACLLAAGLNPVDAAEKDPRLAAALQGNSFLIEEAYNQEPGVVHLSSVLRRQGNDWGPGVFSGLASQQPNTSILLRRALPLASFRWPACKRIWRPPVQLPISACD
jgi:hypothetical protein